MASKNKSGCNCCLTECDAFAICPSPPDPITVDSNGLDLGDIAPCNECGGSALPNDVVVDQVGGGPGIYLWEYVEVGADDHCDTEFAIRLYLRCCNNEFIWILDYELNFIVGTADKNVIRFSSSPQADCALASPVTLTRNASLNCGGGDVGETSDCTDCECEFINIPSDITIVA